jgi:hypothetical protein
MNKQQGNENPADDPNIVLQHSYASNPK